jgi:hypothetical protein
MQRQDHRNKLATNHLPITQTAGLSAGRLQKISLQVRYTAAVIHCSSFCLGAAPT